MLTYQEAITQILATVQRLPPHEIPLPDALGLVLAEGVTTQYAVPPFTNSAMDGFAVSAGDIAGASEQRPIMLPITGESAAGDTTGLTLAPQTALRIMTGAPLPAGADTVVPIEDTEVQGEQVQIKAAYAQGRFIREAGEDVESGTMVVPQGALLRPAEIGMCAVAGRLQVQAYPRPRVGIISTGNELVEPGNTLKPGQIYNSNAYALAAQVSDAGGAVVQRLHARDTPEDVRAAFDACADCDVILTSGGVSVGEHDHVKAVFSERGTLDFWRVAIRPGKPLAFGQWGKTLFFGLPGNPVSSMVTFELFVRPALLKMRGLTDLFRPTIQARLTSDTGHETGRQSYQRAFVTRGSDDCLVTPIGGQGSHQMRGMVAANALLVMPMDVAHVPAGKTMTVLLLDSSISL